MGPQLPRPWKVVASILKPVLGKKCCIFLIICYFLNAGRGEQKHRKQWSLSFGLFVMLNTTLSNNWVWTRKSSGQLHEHQPKQPRCVRQVRKPHCQTTWFRNSPLTTSMRFNPGNCHCQLVEGEVDEEDNQHIIRFTSLLYTLHSNVSHLLLSSFCTGVVVQLGDDGVSSSPWRLWFVTHGHNTHQKPLLGLSCYDIWKSW